MPAGTVPGGGAGEPAEYLPLPPGVTYGAGLNERDVAGVAEFVRGLAVHHIIPNLEQRIRVLNHQVWCLAGLGWFVGCSVGQNGTGLRWCWLACGWGTAG